MKYQNLEDLLRKNKCPKDKKHTHTRIPNKNLNVFGGSYYIEDSLMPEFWHHYYNKVWKKNLFEYLTERQIADFGASKIYDVYCLLKIYDFFSVHKFKLFLLIKN